jgi:SAM-dependent methyltransferase
VVAGGLRLVALRGVIDQALLHVCCMRKLTRIAALFKSLVRPLWRNVYIPIRNVAQRIADWRRRSRKAILEFWKEPDPSNIPETYLENEQTRPRSLFLLNMIRKYADRNAKILEIGCNVGRNLDYLFRAGFHNLAGIEVSEKAVQLLEHAYPEMAHEAKIYIAPAEEVIRQFGDGEFDIVFTLSTLMYIHPDSEWVFPEMVRITKSHLITIENEVDTSWKCFARNYREVFEGFGVEQIEEVNWGRVDDLKSLPHYFNYFARVFRRESSHN